MMYVAGRIVDAWWAWMAPMAWQVALLGAAVWAIDRIARRRAWPQLLHALWLLVLLKLVLPPSLGSPVSLARVVPVDNPGDAIAVSAPDPPSGSSALATGAADTPIMAAGSAAPVSPMATRPLPWRTILFATWLAGLIAFGGWIVVRWRALDRLLGRGRRDVPPWLAEALASAAGRLGRKRVPALVVLPGVESPGVFGLVRPVVFVPTERIDGLTREDAEHIFLHELSHMRRGDLAVHALVLVLQAAYWFHPIVWIAGRRIRRLRELCCDATVSNLLRDGTAAYRSTLLRAARDVAGGKENPALGFLGLTEDAESLVERLRRLEGVVWERNGRTKVGVTIAVLVVAGCVLPMGRRVEAAGAGAAPGRMTEPDTSMVARSVRADVARNVEAEILVNRANARPAETDEIPVTTIVRPTEGNMVAITTVTRSQSPLWIALRRDMDSSRARMLALNRETDVPRAETESAVREMRARTVRTTAEQEEAMKPLREQFEEVRRRMGEVRQRMDAALREVAISGAMMSEERSGMDVHRAIIERARMSSAATDTARLNIERREMEAHRVRMETAQREVTARQAAIDATHREMDGLASEMRRVSHEMNEVAERARINAQDDGAYRESMTVARSRMDAITDRMRRKSVRMGEIGGRMNEFGDVLSGIIRPVHSLLRADDLDPAVAAILNSGEKIIVAVDLVVRDDGTVEDARVIEAPESLREAVRGAAMRIAVVPELVRWWRDRSGSRTIEIRGLEFSRRDLYDSSPDGIIFDGDERDGDR